MFQCKTCQSTEFKLVVQPQFDGNIDIHTNEHDEVLIKAGSQEFIADLLFMNQFAVCKRCNGIKQWEYFFPKTVVNLVK